MSQNVKFSQHVHRFFCQDPVRSFVGRLKEILVSLPQRNYVFVEGFSWKIKTFSSPFHDHFIFCKTTMNSISNDDLIKFVTKLTDINTWDDECGACSKTCLLHVSICMRTEEVLPDKLLGMWKMFKGRIKPIWRNIKEEKKKIHEGNLLMDEIKLLMKNMNKITIENIGKFFLSLVRI